MKNMKNPWDFTQPVYDQRTSCFINAGTNRGVGKAQPVGSFEHSMRGAVPVGRPPQLKVDEVTRKNLRIDME